MRRKFLLTVMTLSLLFCAMGAGDLYAQTEVATSDALQTALNSDGEVKLINNITVDATVTVAESVTATLDLNGFVITGTMHKSNGGVIKNNGSLTLIGGTIKSTADNGGSALVNSGEAIVNNVTLIGAPNAGESWPAYTVNNTGVMSIINSELTSYHGTIASYGEGAVVTMTDTDIDMSGIAGFTNHAIYTYNNGAAVVYSGNIANNATDQNNTGGSVINGAVTIYGGNFNGRVEEYYGRPVIYAGTFKHGETNLNVSKYVAEGCEYNDGVVTAPEGYIFTAEQLKTALQKSGTYTLGADITVTEQIEVPFLSGDYKPVEIALNLNGHKIIADGKIYPINNNGNLTINDIEGNTGGIEGLGLLNGKDGASGNTRSAAASLTINGGTYKNLFDEGAALYAHLGSITINGGRFIGKHAAVWNENANYINISGGYFEGDYAAIINEKYIKFDKGELNGLYLGENGYSCVVSDDVIVYEARIIKNSGYTSYKTLEDAVEGATDGDVITIITNHNGSYEVPSGKNITITGADVMPFIKEMPKEPIKFANIGAHNMGGASMTFNNVTFEYAETSTYKGLQHSNELTYNNCTFNGQVFLYGVKETFNKCIFNTKDSNNYNVWTYGAKEVAFNECTFNSAGKSVLIYAEGASIFNNVDVTECTFNASAPVEGKAAIEMDSSRTAGINLTIDGETTATGFGSGNVSGNSLWNNKMGNNNDANNDITVVVDGETVLKPIYMAQIGDTKHRTLQEAVNAVKNGETITLLSDVTENVTLTEATGLYYTIDGGGKNMNGTITVNSLSDINDNRRITIMNIKFVDNTDANVNFISSVNTNHYPRLTVEGCTFTGSGNNGDVAVRLKSSHSVVINGCKGTGLHSFLQNTSGWNLTIENVTVTDSKSGLSLGTVQGVTVKDSNIDVNGYGIRLDANTYNNNAVIETCTVNAFIPVVVRNVNTESSITFNGTNTMTQTNTDGLWCAIGTSEYETEGIMPTDHTGKVTVTLNDTGLSMDGVYGAYVPVAKIGDVEYTTLEDAFKAATSGCTIEILSDVTVDYDWDCRYTGSKFTVPVTIDGKDKTIAFTAKVYDGGNYLSAFRFEADATVKNLKIDMTKAVSGFNGRFRAISSKANLTVDKCTFIGNGSTNNTRAIIFGEGAGTNAANLAIAITNSTFNGWGRGITDNENAKDVNNVTVTSNTLTDAAVYVSAHKNVTFTDNKVTDAYVNIKSYTEDNKLGVTANGNTLTANVNETKQNSIKAGGVINAQEEFVIIPNPNSDELCPYVNETTIWGETWSNARESYVIKVLNAKGDVMGTSSLNTTLYQMDGDVRVTWHITLPGITDNDKYWIQNWVITPNINNMPAKVVLCVDGVNVEESLIQFNGPDNINKVYAATTDADGDIIRFYNTLAGALAANTNNNAVVVVRDVNENITDISNVTLVSGVEGGVSVTSTYNDDYVYFNNVNVKNGVTLNIPNVYSSSETSVNTIEGILNVGIYYHSRDAKTTIKNGGKVATTGMTIVRYNNKADAGIYIYGDGDDNTVEFSCQGDAIGAYSGTFYAENAVVETKYLRLDYKKDGSEESDEYAPINANFVNSKVRVNLELRLYKDANLTLNGTTVNAGKVQVRKEATPVVNMTSSTIYANSVENLDGATINAVLNNDGTVTFKRIALVGAGTTENPYLINDIEELVWFREQVNGGENYSGIYFKLNANIDLAQTRAASNWVPIGTNDYPFKGTFDGAEKVVSNLNINHPGGEVVVDNVGFFGTTHDATIKNLTINNASVTGSGRVAAVVGNFFRGTMTNVHLTGNIQIAAYQYVGGLIGWGYATVENCSVTGDGIATSCIKKVAKTEIYGSGTNGYVGGICGWIGEGNSVITESSVKDVTITTNDDTVGGICGIFHYGNSFTDCTLESMAITAPDNDGYNGIIAGDVRTNAGYVNTYSVKVTDVTAEAAGVELPALGHGSEYSEQSFVDGVYSGIVGNQNDAVAKIGDTKYYTIQAAVNAASEGSEIEVYANTTENVTIPEGAKLTIKFNENITLNGYILAPNADLTINDGTISNTNSAKSAVQINAGKLELNNVNITSARHAMRIEGTNGEVIATINGGTYKLHEVASQTQHVLNAGGDGSQVTVTINNGTFVGPKGMASDSGAAVNVNNNASVTIKDGVFSNGKNNTLSKKPDAELIVYGGTFDQDPTAYVAEGYTVQTNEEDKYEVFFPVAQIGTKCYADLHEAMGAAKSGETVKLVNDVDLAGTEWEPVSFKGIFDGQGKTIKNLTINKPGVSYTGFITSLNGSFGNVIFENPTVTGGESTAVVAGCAGGGAAYAHHITITGTIKVETTHSGYARAGGIVGGWAYGKYENITIDGVDKAASYIKHTGGGDGRYVAGIVGHADDVESYTNCIVKNITISGGWLCGGIAGPGPSDGLASGCSVENIDMGADYSGGMFGWYYGNGTIENSSVEDVTFTDGSTNNGAIGGYSNNENATVKNVTIDNVKNENGEPIFTLAATIKEGDDTYCYATLEAAFTAATEGQTITLLADATPALTSQKAITNAAVIDLDGKTLTLTEDDLYFGTTIFQNGNIVVDPSVNASTAVFWMFANQTLTFDDVELTATGVTGTYLIGINGGTGSNVNLLNGTKIIIDNESQAALSAVICDNGTGNNVKIENSDIDVKNIGGRFYLGGTSGNITVDNTDIDLNGVKEGFYLRANQTLSIEGNTTIDVVLNETTEERYGINFTDVNYTYTVEETATVNATVYEPVAIAQIGTTKYPTLQGAIAAVQNDETITLINNCELSESIKVNNNITLDLNGKTITGTDNATASFALIEIQPGKELTVTDGTVEKNGKITLTATNDRDWNAYSSVISNQRGKLTVNGGTIEHLGGTDMAYGIDNLTNGKGTYAETIITGGTVKSTYRAIRQFLNGTEAQNILTVNGGIIEGANKSIWMQDPSKNANTGTLTVDEDATLKGDVYLFVTDGSTSWPVEVSIAAAALAEGSEVISANVPAGYEVKEMNGLYGVYHGVAKIGYVLYESLAEAATAAQNGETIELLWQEGQAPIAMNASLYGKNVTITGDATVDWSKGNLFIGRGGEGNATLTFDNANLTSYSNSNSYGIHVSGREKNTNNKYDGTLVINKSTIELDYLINRGTIELDKGNLTVKNGFGIAGRPGTETESGEDATATITLNNESKVVVNNHNGMGLGIAAPQLEGFGIMNINSGSTFETTQSFTVTAKVTMNVDGGNVKVDDKLTNNGTVNIKDATVKLAKLDNDNLMFISGTNTLQVEDASGTSFALRARDGVVFNNSYVKGTANEIMRLLGSATFNGGFECAYLQGQGVKADANNSGVGGTITIEEGTTVHATYGVDFSNNYIINGGTIELSGGNADGGIWGCVFQNGEYTINSNVIVNGGGKTAPIHFTYATAVVNGNITHSNPGGEVIYLKNSEVTFAENSVVTTTGVHVNEGSTLTNKGEISGNVNVNVKLISENNITGNITKADAATIILTGGTYTQDVNAWCHEDYDAIYNGNNTWTVIQVAGTQTRELATPGWYWFSTYIDLEGSAGLEKLQNAFNVEDQNGNIVCVGNSIKSRTQFSQYYDGYGWDGNLQAITTAQMYMINTDPVTLELTGDFVEAGRQIPLVYGWNSIGYPVRNTMSINDAFENIFVPTEGDVFKSKNKTSFYEDGEWFPEITLEPGHGYMYQSKSSESKTLVYKSNNNRNTENKTNIDEVDYHWLVDATQYPGNMTIVAMLSIDNEIVKYNYEIAAFANGECRGSARPMYNDRLGAYILILTIHGEEVEELTFKYYDVNYGTEYELSNRINYSDNAIVGSFEEPYMFNLGILNIDETSVENISIYPNPTTTGKEINLQAMCDKVEVFNALGVKVAEYTNVDSIDAIETAGIYVIRVTIDGNARNCRLVVR